MSTVVILGAPPLGARLRHWTGLTVTLARKNFRQRYLRSRLGIAWALVQPTLQALVLTFVFVKIFKVHRVPHFPVYLLSGVMCWQFFQQGTLGGTSSVVDNASLVSKVSVPNVVFPVAAVGGSLIVFALQLVVVGVAGGISHTLGREVPAVLLVLPLEFALASGFGVLLCSIHVAIRDIRFLAESLLLMAFYLSPVIWSPSQLSPTLAHILRFNPMVGVLSLMRGAAVGRPIDWTAVGISAIAALLVWSIALPLFRRRSGNFADLV